jgi:hypothetical protein
VVQVVVATALTFQVGLSLMQPLALITQAVAAVVVLLTLETLQMVVLELS